MKILCICEGGNVRSVTMARLLKDQGHDALAVSWRDNSIETLQMLSKWAEAVYWVDDKKKLSQPEQLREPYHWGFQFIDIKKDRWGKAHEQELMEILSQEIEKLDLPNVEATKEAFSGK